MAGDPRVDPILALGTYLLVRCEGSGYMFCPCKAADAGRVEMRSDVQMNNGVFLDALRVSFLEAGVDSYRFFGTHSFKRGFLQLFKSLGVPDAEIMDRGFWESDTALYAYLPTADRLEARHKYCSPYAVIADLAASGKSLDPDMLTMILE